MHTQIFMLENTISEIGKAEEGVQASGDIINEWIKLWVADDEESFAKSLPKNEKTDIVPAIQTLGYNVTTYNE